MDKNEQYKEAVAELVASRERFVELSSSPVFFDTLATKEEINSAYSALVAEHDKYDALRQRAETLRMAL